MKKKYVEVINPFLFSLTKYDDRRIPNVLSMLMLDPRYKYLKLIFSFIDHEQGVAMEFFKIYDKKSLFLMFWKVYHHLHPLLKGETSFLDKIEKNCNLDFSSWW